MVYINILDLQTILMNNLAGTVTLFLFISLVVIAMLAAKFRMPNIFMILMIVAFIMIVNPYPLLMVLSIIVIGLVIGFVLSKFGKN